MSNYPIDGYPLNIRFNQRNELTETAIAADKDEQFDCERAIRRCADRRHWAEIRRSFETSVALPIPDHQLDYERACCSIPPRSAVGARATSSSARARSMEPDSRGQPEVARCHSNGCPSIRHHRMERESSFTMKMLEYAPLFARSLDLRGTTWMGQARRQAGNRERPVRRCRASFLHIRIGCLYRSRRTAWRSAASRKSYRSKASENMMTVDGL
jgi:hypothetical protein